MQIPHIIDKIYIKDKFTGEVKVFDTLEEAHEFQKKWDEAILTEESFRIMWNEICGEVYLNFWEEFKITNKDMRDIIDKIFYFSIEEYRKKVGIK